MVKLIPPGWKPPTITVFRLLMTAFKNSDGNWDDTHFQDAEAVVDACYSNGFRPDITIMNTMLAACVRESMWRRGIVIINDMQHFHGLIPTAHTFDILLNCCRHTVEEPAIIFQTLRLQGLPREYSYRAAVLNAGNRISPQVALESLYEINKLPSLSGGFTESYVYGKTYMPPVLRKTHHGQLKMKSSYILKKERGKSSGSRSIFGGVNVATSNGVESVTDSSFVSSSIDSVSTFGGFKPGFQDSVSLSHGSQVESENAAVKLLKKKKKMRKWNLFRDSMKNQLPRNSPGKLMTTGSVVSFEKQIEKILKTELKAVNTKIKLNETRDRKFTGSGIKESEVEHGISVAAGMSLESTSAAVSVVVPTSVPFTENSDISNIIPPFQPDVSWVSQLEEEDTVH